MDKFIYDLIIIGSGPAAYTAGIYTSRAFIKTLILTGPQIGGQLMTTTEIENFPGFEEGILGPQLMEKMKKQAERFGVEVKIETVQNVKFQTSNDPSKSLMASKSNSNIKDQKIFLVRTEENEYISQSVIIATGASAKKLGIPSEERFQGKGISYCATCDGFFFRGKNVAVLGGGDTAMEEANFLTRFAEKVTIIHRRDEFRASPIMLERAKKNPKINFLTNKIIEEFTGDMTIKTIRLSDNINGKIEDFAVDGVFVAIGHKPSTNFLKGLIDTDEKGYILIKKLEVKSQKLKEMLNENYQTATSVSGVFAAGDCTDPHYRQAIVAAGMGAKAAIDVQNYLESQTK